MNNKFKIFLLFASIIIIILMIVLAVFLIFKKTKNPQSDFNKLSDFGMVTYTQIDNENLYYLDTDHLTFYKLNLNQQKPEKIIENFVYYIDKVIWSPQKKEAILKTTNSKDAVPSWSVNNFESKKNRLLDENTIDAIWSNDGEKIISLLKNENKYIINSQNKNGDQKKIFFDLKENRCDRFVAIDDTLTNGFCIAINSDISVQLKKIDFQNSTIQTIDDDFSDAKPSKDGQKLLVIKNEEDKSYLVILDFAGNVATKLKLSLDLYNLEKFAWSTDASYLIGAFQTGNDKDEYFYKIDAASGNYQKLKYNSGNVQLNAINLKISEDNSILYFTSDDILYKLKID